VLIPQAAPHLEHRPLAHALPLKPLHELLRPQGRAGSPPCLRPQTWAAKWVGGRCKAMPASPGYRRWEFVAKDAGAQPVSYRRLSAVVHAAAGSRMGTFCV